MLLQGELKSVTFWQKEMDRFIFQFLLAAQ